MSKCFLTLTLFVGIFSCFTYSSENYNEDNPDIGDFLKRFNADTNFENQWDTIVYALQTDIVNDRLNQVLQSRRNSKKIPPSSTRLSPPTSSRSNHQTLTKQPR